MVESISERLGVKWTIRSSLGEHHCTASFGFARHMLITENLLDLWVRGHAEKAQGLAVELVSRLCAASCPRPNQRRFPLIDSVGQPGPDGVLDVESGFSPFVPDGLRYCQKVWIGFPEAGPCPAKGRLRDAPRHGRFRPDLGQTVRFSFGRGGRSWYETPCR